MARPYRTRSLRRTELTHAAHGEARAAAMQLARAPCRLTLFVMDICPWWPDSVSVPDDDIPAKARKLVKDLEDVTASADALAGAVASAIRKERAAGLPYKPPAPAGVKTRKPRAKSKTQGSRKTTARKRSVRKTAVRKTAPKKR
jgi:hypothetical protein